jgi:hypothetical protein
MAQPRSAMENLTFPQALEMNLRGRAATPPNPKRAGWKYDSMPALVIEAGRGYSPQALTRPERHAAEEAIKLFHKAGFTFGYQRCFFNAQMLARFSRAGELVYVEGYRLDGDLRSLPILHGWVTINDKVVDPTATTVLEQAGAPEPRCVLGEYERKAYWGIAFDSKYVVKRSGSGGKDVISLIDDCQGGFPLLRDGLPTRSRQRRGR